MSENLFTVSATLKGSVEGKEVLIDSFNIEYHNELLKDDWVDEKGYLTPKGVQAMMLGYASGLASVAHAAHAHHGADTAAMLRQAIEMLENQFFLVTEATPVMIDKPLRDDTQPEEVP